MLALIWLFFFLLVLTPSLDRKIPIMSTVGKNTLAVYLLHAFPVKLMDHFGLAADFTPLQTLATAVVILLVFGNDPIGRFFNKFFTGRWLEKLWNRMEPKQNRKNHYD